MRTRAGGVSRPTQGRFGGGKGARCLTRYARRRCDRGSPARAQQRAGRAPRPHGQGLAQLLSPSRWAEGAGGPHACSVLLWPRPPSGRQGQRPRDQAGAPLAGGPGGRGHREAWLMGGRVNPLSWPRRGCRALAVSGPGWARAQRVRLSTRTFCAERALPAPPAPSRCASAAPPLSVRSLPLPPPLPAPPMDFLLRVSHRNCADGFGSGKGPGFRFRWAPRREVRASSSVSRKTGWSQGRHVAGAPPRGGERGLALSTQQSLHPGPPCPSSLVHPPGGPHRHLQFQMWGSRGHKVTRPGAARLPVQSVPRTRHRVPDLCTPGMFSVGPGKGWHLRLSWVHGAGISDGTNAVRGASCAGSWPEPGG